MHPLTPDLSALKDDELHKKVSEITQKLSQSYRFGSYELAGQLHMILEDYNAELDRRYRKTIEELAAKNDKFDGLIDVK